MSAGAVFKLIANDGKADRMIMATKLLNQRIKDVMCARKAAKKEDITPTLVDLERTHIIYVNAHFKPFAAIGYEYNKVRPSSGGTSFGSTVTFSIPQFGDFFHDMVCRVRIGQTVANVGQTPQQGTSPLFPANYPQPMEVTAIDDGIKYANAWALEQSLSNPNSFSIKSADQAVLRNIFDYVEETTNYNAAPSVGDIALIAVAVAGGGFFRLAEGTLVGSFLAPAGQAASPPDDNAGITPPARSPNNANVTADCYAFDALFQRIKVSNDVADGSTNQLELSDLGYQYFYNYVVGYRPKYDKTSQFYNIVDAFGNVIVPGVDNLADAFPSVNYRNFVRYAEYPGNRLFNNVKFDVNGNPLDQYDYVVPTMLEKFCIMPNKRTGHDRLVGQEVPLVGYGGLQLGKVSDTDNFNTPAGISRSTYGQSNQTVSVFNAKPITSSPVVFYPQAGAEFPGFPVAKNSPTAPTVLNTTTPAFLNDNYGAGLDQFDVSRNINYVVNGPQTPKPVQAPLEIWNKLRFWFNDDVRLSIPSVSIPFGQRFITIDLAQCNNILFEYPSIYLEKIECTIEDYSSPSDPLQSAFNKRTKTYKPIFVQNGISEPTIDKLELYVNNIFVNPEVHDIFIKRVGFSLIRVYRQQSQRVNQDTNDEKLLSQLKWPIEYMFVGVRPAWNTANATVSPSGAVTGNVNQWRDWHRLTKQVDAVVDEVQLSETNGYANVVPYVDLGTQQAYSSSSIGQVVQSRYWLPVPTVDSLTLTTHGINIFDNFQDTMYNAYMPFHFGGSALVTPDDPGALFVNMSLFPRSYQPSGHLNISRARETYLNWTTSYVSSKTPADLLVVAVAINFLLVTDGSAVLRYST